MPKKVSLRLTALGVKRHTRPGRIADGGGLYLQTSESGSKSWLFRYRLGNRNRAHGIGAVDTVSLEQARSEALRCRLLVREGVDPIDERKTRLSAALASKALSQTFRDVAEAFVEANESGWRNAKHVRQWRTTLATYVYPKIGNLPVSFIATAHVLQCIEPIWKLKPETASRLRGRIEQVLDYAKARDLRAGENVARWKGHLDQALPARNDVAPTVHHKALPYQEVPEFFARLVRQEGITPVALQLLILTCARTNEIIGARPAEFDLSRGLWIVPPDRMKAKREWRVPLAREAVALVRNLDRSGHHLFVGSRGGAISNMAMLQLMRRMDVDATPHGFRSTFTDWGAETQHFPHEVREMALAHTVGSKVELAYRRGDMVEKRRDLAQAWADFAISKIRSAKAVA